MRSKFNWEAWVFILPTCLLLLAFLVWPTMQTIYYSFFKGHFLDPTLEFVGLSHYDRLFTSDRQFLRLNKWPPSGALINTIVWIIFLPTFTVIFGLIVAILADGKSMNPLLSHSSLFQWESPQLLHRLSFVLSTIVIRKLEF